MIKGMALTVAVGLRERYQVRQWYLVPGNKNNNNTACIIMAEPCDIINCVGGRAAVGGNGHPLP